MPGERGNKAIRMHTAASAVCPSNPHAVAAITGIGWLRALSSLSWIDGNVQAAKVSLKRHSKDKGATMMVSEIKAPLDYFLRGQLTDDKVVSVRVRLLDGNVFTFKTNLRSPKRLDRCSAGVVAPPRSPSPCRKTMVPHQHICIPLRAVRIAAIHCGCLRLDGEVLAAALAVPFVFDGDENFVRPELAAAAGHGDAVRAVAAPVVRQQIPRIVDAAHPPTIIQLTIAA
jgi:hypothetical protein